MTDQNVVFGEAAIRKGLVTESQLGECMAEFQRLIAQGEEIPLASLLIQRGYLNAGQARELSGESTPRLLHCKQCKKTYRVILSGNPPCKTCGGPLIDVTNRKTRPSARQAKVSPSGPAPPPRKAPTAPAGEIHLPAPKPVAPTTDPTDHLVGKRLSDKYELVGRIGHGAMGAVYQARQVRLDRLVAVKILPQELACDPDLMERFKQEARTTAKLEHINVIRVFEVDSDLGYEYLAMEYVEGVTLGQLIEQQPLRPWREAVDMIRQAAVGLGVAHAKQVIHRDIKPANLMLNAEGIVKVMDFGLARLAEGGHASRTGTILGTPHFMSPEQARGDPVDLRTDIYSLGATLFNLLTGRTPFSATNDFALLLKAMEEDPQPAHELNRQLPEEVSIVVQKMMAKDRALRYPDMPSVEMDLKRLLDGQTGQLTALQTHATPKTAPPQSTRASTQRSRKIRLLWGMLGVNLLLLLIAGILFSQGVFSSDEPAPEEAIEQADQESALAFEALTRHLLQAQISTQEKSAACQEFLERYPESPKAEAVKVYLERYRDKPGKTEPGRFPTRKTEGEGTASRIVQLLRQITQARADDDQSLGRELLLQLKQLEADPLELEEYDVWLAGKAAGTQRGAMRPTAIVMLLGQIRDTLLEGKLDEAEKMIAQLQRKKTLLATQQGELDELAAVLAVERKPSGSLTDQVRLTAHAWYRRWAAKRLAQRDYGAADSLLTKALPLNSDRTVQAQIYLQLATIADRRQIPGQALAYHKLAWKAGLRSRAFALRYGWALFSRKQYKASLICFKVLTARPDAPFTNRYLTLIAQLKSGDKTGARALARSLQAQGIPLPTPVIATLRLAPDYNATLVLQEGRRLSGAVVDQTKQSISFRWREGSSIRFRMFPREKIKSISPSSMTPTRFGQAVKQSQRKTTLELQGLINWGELNQQRKSVIQQLRARLELVRSRARTRAGLSCSTCDGLGHRPFECETCNGKGAIRTSCDTCKGQGRRTCTRCDGAGKHTCPGKCGGQGFVDVQVKTTSGFRKERRRCGDCKGKKEIRCLRCRGSKSFSCSVCSGKGSRVSACTRCRGRKTLPCGRCGGRGIQVDAWTAFVLGVGCHVVEDVKGARRFWKDLSKASGGLTAERRQFIIDQLPHLGLTDLLEKLGQ